MFEHFQRNLGLIDETQQQRMMDTRVAICGTGGMGGVCAEVLVRMGFSSLVLVDHDRFEVSNTNRQIHCQQETLGGNKARVLAEAFKKINPRMTPTVFEEGLNEHTVNAVLEDVDIVVNGMDDMRSSLILERRARRLGKTIVNAWITPFASVFVSKPGSPHGRTIWNCRPVKSQRVN